MGNEYARESGTEVARPVDNEDFLVVLVRIAEALERIGNVLEDQQ